MDHLKSIDDLKACAEEFLLYGLDNDSQESFIDKGNQIIGRWKEVHKESENFSLALDGKINEVLHEIERIQEFDLINKFKSYTIKVTELQLIKLAESLELLDRYDIVNNIPQLVINVQKNIPKNCPSNLNVIKSMVEIVAKIKKQLLEDFHKKFEAQMDDQREELSDPQNDWAEFLNSARKWLLGYMMVSLLPFTISDLSLLVEKYQEALDVVFTPLWGKFHFHLQSARMIKSTEQILWTFNYAKSFFHLLTGLCVEITSSSELQEIREINYKDAGLKYISDKTALFMRAHTAQIISEMSFVHNDMCPRLVEASLELDYTLSEIHIPSLFVTTVIADARPLLLEWLQIDRMYFTSSAVTSCVKSDDMFDCQFTNSPSQYTNTNDSPSSLHCFKCLYECTVLLVLSSQRYTNLSPHAQDIFCDLIVEPILCVCLGILLYRVRTNPVLRDLARGSLPYWMQTGRPVEMMMVVSSSEYLQSILTTSVISSLRCKEKRLEQRWKVYRNWITEAALIELSLQALPEYIMNFNQIDEPKILASTVIDTSMDHLSSVLNFVKGQAQAICVGLEEQYLDCKRGHST